MSERLAAASNAPMYTWNDSSWRFRRSVAFRRTGRNQDERAGARELRGERPEDIPITDIDVSVDTLDWRQLGRWDVNEAVSSRRGA